MKVQFPKSKTDSYWDGKVHEIEALQLFQLNSTSFYFMVGKDYSFGGNTMATILRKDGENFVKIPLHLNEYETLFQNTSSLKPVAKPVSILGKKIELGEEISYQELCEKVLGLNSVSCESESNSEKK